jgi:apolipoprotein N-acyltransferase
LLAVGPAVAGRRRWLLAGLLLGLWGGGALLARMEWTQPLGPPFRVSLLQGNIPQEIKWRPESIALSVERYVGMTRDHWESALIVWPETAVPAFADQVQEALLDPLAAEAAAQGVDILLGIPMRSARGGDYYNAMLALGGSTGHYHKQHLVPFGEFMPLKALLAPLLHWMQVPMSDFSRGGQEQPLLRLAGHPAGISICYEDAFGDEVIRGLPAAALLVNASNDAWFGDSLAPAQHLQIARLRALEAGRYLLRATNTGISAIIGPAGELQSVTKAFEEAVLTGEVVPLGGATPYVRIGNWGVVLLALAMLGIGYLGTRPRP